MSTDIVDEESRLALIGGIGIEGESEWVAQSDEMQGDEVESWNQPIYGVVRNN